MCKRNNDALFFTCSLIEQLGRSLHMRRGKVAAELGEAGIQTLYRNADILHCEPIEKVADDVITEFSLQGGNFDNLAEARYTVPDVWTMGKVECARRRKLHRNIWKECIKCKARTYGKSNDNRNL